MNRIAFTCLAVASLTAPAGAVTNDNGDILISQAAVNAGGITPGDTAGFPVTISVPGTYRLATNLTVTTAVNGIQVQANEVTIEMGGHTLAGSGVGRNGIATFNRSLTVRGGTVRGFTLDGVRTIAQFLTIDNVTITGNQRDGVSADGTGPYNVDHVTVRDSNISVNGDDGLECTSYCRVENTSINDNSGYGMFLNGFGGVSLGNTISENNGAGIINGDRNGIGNTTLIRNTSSIVGDFTPLQPNACSPACPPPP